jgi:hypothetical protein
MMSMASRYTKVIRIVLLTVALVASGALFDASVLLADAGADYPGTVVMVDATAGKLAVKKEGGGSRFTFVVNDKTQFGGPGLKSLQDLRQGAAVTVNYIVNGSQYIALKVTAKGK